MSNKKVLDSANLVMLKVNKALVHDVCIQYVNPKII